MQYLDDEGKYAKQYLEEIRELEKTFGLDETYSRLLAFRDYETYSVLPREATFTLSMALLAVVGVVLFITVSLQMTLIVACVVSLVNVFMVGTVFYWGIYMNTILALNMSFCLGVAVDYSTHIAQTYLLVKVPDDIVKSSEQRKYKAQKAIS